MPPIRLGLTDFGWEAVTATAARYGLGVGEFVSASCRRYLAGPEDHPLPEFARSGNSGPPRDLILDLEPAEMRALERHAERLSVPLGTLISHAVLALIADIDSGRVGAELAAGDDRQDS
jgi:hypothetical protein